jgi:mxaK protein
VALRATCGLTRAVLVAAALLLVVALVEGVTWWRAVRINVQIDERIEAMPAPVARAVDAKALDSDGPELRFARATALAAQGATDPALDLYRGLQGDSALGQAARYNSANLLMQRAAELRAGPQAGQAIALIELAKEHYRDVLRTEPNHWDARYNLERAQRLLPDPDETADEPPEAARNRERAVTTMRGYSPGLP